jgi:SAM-dependent methyltransferase
LGEIFVANKGSEFYDHPEIFDTYWSRRNRSESANALLEEPVMLELLGDPAELRILDLGCGDARFGVDLLARGCAEYVGLDGSQKMIEQARETLEGTAGHLVHGTIEEADFAAGRFDVVVSRLALHYIEDLKATFEGVREILADGGRFIFSVEHPVVLSCNASLEQSARRGSWIVDDYFSTGLRSVQWLGGTVEKYHRTVEEYFGLLQASGLTVEALRESKPLRERFPSEEEYERRMRIPLFMMFAARK